MLRSSTVGNCRVSLATSSFMVLLMRAEYTKALTPSAFFAINESTVSSAYGSIMTISSFAERNSCAANSYPLHQDFAFKIPSLGGKFALTKKSTCFSRDKSLES